MALTSTQQFLETIKRSSSPLICLPKGAGIDGYATALGTFAMLQKLEKRVDIVSADGPLPKELHFLADNISIEDTFKNLQQFVIQLDASRTPVDELSYELKNGTLSVYVSPKSGRWESSDVQFHPKGFKYDLLISIGAPDLESFGHLFSGHTEFFYNVPIINIDHTTENEHFGHVNAVDVTASACGEVLHNLLESIEQELIDDHVATACLTGMIAKTKSFKNAHVTPKTLQTASKLMSRGAKREDIVNALYRKRSVGTLRLWGRALARLKSTDDGTCVWTMLSTQDFMHAGAEPEDLHGAVDELMTSSPHAKIIILLYEQGESIRGLVHTHAPFHAKQLGRPFGATGTGQTSLFELTQTSMAGAEQQVLTHIKQELKKTI